MPLSLSPLQVHAACCVVDDVPAKESKMQLQKININANVSSDSSSSSTEEEEEEESSDDDHTNEKESKSKAGSFSSFSSLEESLPLKRGLSSYFSGKSRSFGNLSACANANVEELAKPENPFNKRQRILTSLSRRASCSAIASAMPNLMSLQHAVKEEEGEEEEVPCIPVPRRKEKNAAAFRATCSFSDLQRV